MLAREDRDMALTVALFTFLASAIVFGAIGLFVGREKEHEVLRQRMDSVRKAERRGEVSPDLKLIRDEMYSSVPLFNRLLMRLSWSGKLQGYIHQAGMVTRPAKIILWSAVLGAGAYLLFARILSHYVLLAIIAGILATMLPISVLWFRRRRRLRQFEERFPETLDLLGRAVRTGHAFTTGLEMVAKESPEPVAGEFRKTFEEQNFGLPLRDALINMTERVPLVDVRFFVTALLVQKETGGNLAEILDELSRVIRDRFRIYREVQVKTAQGRLTAMILVSLPLAMMAVLEAFNPAYMRGLFDDPLGPTILGIAAALQVVGSLMLWKIVHIEV
jgi:tight adherence protein B